MPFAPDLDPDVIAATLALRHTTGAPDNHTNRLFPQSRRARVRQRTVKIACDEEKKTICNTQVLFSLFSFTELIRTYLNMDEVTTVAA